VSIIINDCLVWGALLYIVVVYCLAFEAVNFARRKKMSKYEIPSPMVAPWGTLDNQGIDKLIAGGVWPGKPFVGMRLINGAIVHASAQRRGDNDKDHIVLCHWETEPYTPWVVWAYSLNNPGHAVSGVYCKTKSEAIHAFHSRLANTAPPGWAYLPGNKEVL
jgi:hypothetical protein